MRNRKNETLILAVSGVVILSYVLYVRQKSPNLENAKLREVQELSTKVPVFSGFNEVGRNSKSGYTSVDLTKYFHSTASFDDVKAFYSTILEKDGWVLADENISEGKRSGDLTFKKGQFSISIFHTESSSIYNYAIDFVWTNPS